jgi:hypothetical protein
MGRRPILAQPVLAQPVLAQACRCSVQRSPRLEVGAGEVIARKLRLLAAAVALAGAIRSAGARARRLTTGRCGLLLGGPSIGAFAGVAGAGSLLGV